ncbi:hypothetical protein COU54_02365 [Candidatus Pacearchaeota archaeon CG10_big_fil_rev_8_21_14_0_10_31_24]|nr:MAG: hypothetical protein COU54_02365 [Candidatus Pacearchaeota archaeon CG10_big_fil_rev_8_21_14_0_10_31_24]
MIEVKTKLMKWGNSLGIIVPLSKIKNTNLIEGEEVTALIIQKNKGNLKRLFGARKFKKSTKEIMKEIDEELYSV